MKSFDFSLGTPSTCTPVPLMKTLSIYAPWAARSLLTEMNSGQKISWLWGAGHPVTACCVDHSKVRHHSAFCRVEAFSSIWIQMSWKWEHANWKYWVILVIKGCRRIWGCEGWCSLPPSLRPSLWAFQNCVFRTSFPFLSEEKQERL